MSDLRYELVISSPAHRGQHDFTYGPWHIEPANWTRPSSMFDWDWWHKDYDGADDANDHRYGSASSSDECIKQIHAWEDEQ
jgi:hypothetical protein